MILNAMYELKNLSGRSVSLVTYLNPWPFEQESQNQ